MKKLFPHVFAAAIRQEEPELCEASKLFTVYSVVNIQKLLRLLLLLGQLDVDSNFNGYISGVYLQLLAKP